MYANKQSGQAELKILSVSSLFKKLKKSMQEKPSWDEVELLINRGIKICNRYSVIIGEPAVALSNNHLDNYQKIVELLSSQKE